MVFYCFFLMISEKNDIWPGKTKKMYVIAKLWKLEDNDIHHSQVKIYSKKKFWFKTALYSYEVEKIF